MPALSFNEVLRTTGAMGQRKGLEPYADRVVTLKDFKIETRGRGEDREGNPREKRRVLTATVVSPADKQSNVKWPDAKNLKARRALIPKRIAGRFMEAIELKADEGDDSLEISDVLVKVGDHGATLHDPNDYPRSQGGWADEPSETGQSDTPRRGRPRRNAERPVESAA